MCVVLMRLYNLQIYTKIYMDKNILDLCQANGGVHGGTNQIEMAVSRNY